MESGVLGIDKLKYLYLISQERLIPETEAMKTNLTQVFFQSLDDKIENKELINIHIKGEVATGKSTVAMAIQEYINNKLKISEREDTKHIDPYYLIVSDQTEYLRNPYKKDFRNICIMIDEYNRMAETGYNATTESQRYAYESDVLAQRYIHKISCSPARITDLNATIILTVMTKDIAKQITRLKLEYRNADDFSTATIGYVDIYVGDIIQRDYYKRYREKKFLRMRLLEDNGVRDIRECEFAVIEAEAYNELSRYSGLFKTKADTMTLVNTVIKRIIRSKGLTYSILAIGEVTQETMTLLTLNKTMKELAEKARKESNIHKRAGLEELAKLTEEALKKEIEEKKKLIEVYDKYLTINPELTKEKEE